jgi:glycosyltransferase involved in cell wall biosynthesis
MNSIYYSIIIPHKNTPHLLQRCLDSIPQRKDVEIIIVDDNSDSSIVDFNEFPGNEREDVFVFFNKSNIGPGRARNTGIEHAKGKWIIFIDSDDFFNYCLKDVLDYYKSDQSDVIYFTASSVDSNTYLNSPRADAFVEIIFQYLNNKSTGEMLLRYVLASPWGKLIKKSLLIDHNIIFPDVLICEDVKFSYMLGLYAKQIKADIRALCCYTSRSVSRSSVLSEDVFLDKIRVYAERDKFLMDNHIPLPYGSGYVDTLIDLDNQNNKDLYNKCLDILKEYDIPQELVCSLINSKKELTQHTTKRKIINRIRTIWALRLR